MYADDTTLFYTQPNLADIEFKTNQELDKVCNWFKVNKLIINLTKTNYIIFHSNYYDEIDVLDNVSISIDSVPLNKVNNVNFLGVQIQSNMNWDLHITNVANKVSKCIGIIYKLKNVLPESVLVLLYNTFMLPYLNYCITVWGNQNLTKIRSLHILQKRHYDYVQVATIFPIHPLFSTN